MIEALILFATLGIFAGLIAGMFGISGRICNACFGCLLSSIWFDEAMIHSDGTSLGCIVF